MWGKKSYISHGKKQMKTRPEGKNKMCVKTLTSVSLLQPSFLTSHLKQDPATAVSILVSASTHFRAINVTGPSTLIDYTPNPGDNSTVYSEDKEAEEIKNGAIDELTTKTGDMAAGEQGSNNKEDSIGSNVQSILSMCLEWYNNDYANCIVAYNILLRHLPELRRLLCIFYQCLHHQHHHC